MEPKVVSTKWAQLELALTGPADDGALYLHVPTGEVFSFLGLDDDLAAGEIYSGLEQGRLLYIEPLLPRVAHGWISEFAESVSNQALRRAIRVALSDAGASDRFKRLLRRNPDERQRWFAFRSARLRQAAREWLEERGIAAR